MNQVIEFTPHVVSQEAGDQSLKIQALKDEALRLWEVDQQSALDLGKALIAVRDALAEDHGAFAAWFRESGLEENRVYYCIRKAEGKIPSSEEEKVDVYLYQAHLALAKLVPTECDRPLQAAEGVVHLGPDGVTVTDGKFIARVSLAGATEEASIPLAMLEANLPNAKCNGGPQCALSVGKTRISSDRDGVTKTVAVPKTDYPAYQKVLDKFLPAFSSDEGVTTVTFGTKHLRMLCDFIDDISLVPGAISIKVATSGGNPYAYVETETANGHRAEVLMTLPAFPALAKPKVEE